MAIDFSELRGNYQNYWEPFNENSVCKIVFHNNSKPKFTILCNVATDFENGRLILPPSCRNDSILINNLIEKVIDVFINSEEINDSLEEKAGLFNNSISNNGEAIDRILKDYLTNVARVVRKAFNKITGPVNSKYQLYISTIIMSFLIDKKSSSDIDFQLVKDNFLQLTCSTPVSVLRRT